MATYTKLNYQNIQSLADNYGLKIIEFLPIEGGNGNSSYILKAHKASYVLTVCDDKNFKEVLKMGELLLLLESNNVPCNRLVLTSENKVLTTFTISNSVKPVILKKYIEGHVVKNIDETMLFQVGMQAAQLNKVPSPDYLPTAHPFGRQLFSNALGLNIDLKYESWLSKEIVYLEQHISTSLPKGLIHGDLFYDNLLFSSLSKKSMGFKAIIDFEEACNYYLVFELGMCIVGSCSEGILINLNKARAFVHGYQQVRPLIKKEKESLQLFIRYAAVATSYWRFNQYNIKEPDKSKATHHWQMVQVSKGISEILDTHFYDAIFSED